MNEIWPTVLAVASAIVLLSNAIEKIVKAVKAAKAPEQKQNEEIEDIKTRLEKVENFQWMTNASRMPESATM